MAIARGKIGDASSTTKVMVVAILVSTVAFLDSTVVNLALPAIKRDLGGGLATQQWVVDGYLLALAVTILPGGSISDLFGRVPVLRFGLAAFSTGLVLAATADSPAMLITGRVVQGLGGAFLVPGSLALIDSAFDNADRPAAIGSWTAWTGSAFAIGPLLGGLAVDYLSWRWVFVLGVVPIVIGFALTFWLCPMPGPSEHARVDIVGAGFQAVGLSAAVFALIESQRRGWADPVVAASIVVGVVALLPFVAWERRAPHPMLPLNLFANRNFTGANLMTAFFYGGLSMGGLSIALYVQEVAGYPATVAGLATLPSPIISFLFARHVGRSAARLGPRLFLITGPVVAGVGYLLIRPDAHRFHVIANLLPGMIVFAVGTVLTSTPLTALNLSSVDTVHGGIASAIQNSVGRLSALIATACVGLIAASALTNASFGRLLQVSAALFFIAAAVGTFIVANPTVPAEPVPCEVAAMCRDRHDAHPHLIVGSSRRRGRSAADDHGT
jgi:EmrB/QacA subfamily drug resistance transporter